MGGEGRSTTTRRVGRDFVVGDNSRHKKALPEFCVSVCVCMFVCPVDVWSGNLSARYSAISRTLENSIVFLALKGRRHRT